MATQRGRVAAAWSAGVRIAGMAAGFGASVIAARLLGQRDYGVYVLAMSVVAVGAILAHFGLPRLVVRIAAEALAFDDEAAARTSIIRVIRLAVAGAALIGGALSAGLATALAWSVFESLGLERVATILGLVVAVEGLRLVVSESFRGLGDIRAALLLGDNARAVLLALGLLALGGLDRTPEVRSVILVVLGSGIAVLGLSSVLLYRELHSMRRGPRHVAILGSKPILLAALPLTVLDFTGLFVNVGDAWVVGWLRDESDVALYSVGVRLALLLTLPLYIVNSVLAPEITRLHTLGRFDRLEFVIRRAATIATATSVVGYAVLLVAGRPLLGLLFGSEYEAAWGMLVLLAFGVVFGVAAGSCSLALVMTGHGGVVARVSVVVFILTFAAEVAGEHAWGLNGVALASSLGTVLQNTLLTLSAHRRLGIWTFADPRKLFDRATWGAALRPAERDEDNVDEPSTSAHG